MQKKLFIHKRNFLKILTSALRIGPRGGWKPLIFVHRVNPLKNFLKTYENYKSIINFINYESRNDLKSFNKQTHTCHAVIESRVGTKLSLAVDFASSFPVDGFLNSQLSALMESNNSANEQRSFFVRFSWQSISFWEIQKYPLLSPKNLAPVFLKYIKTISWVKLFEISKTPLISMSMKTWLYITTTEIPNCFIFLCICNFLRSNIIYFLCHKLQIY